MEEPVSSPFNQHLWGFLRPSAWKWSNPVGVQEPTSRSLPLLLSQPWSHHGRDPGKTPEEQKLRKPKQNPAVSPVKRTRPSQTVQHRLTQLSQPPHLNKCPRKDLQWPQHSDSQTSWAKNVQVALNHYTSKVVCFLTTERHNEQNYFQSNPKPVLSNRGISRHLKYDTIPASRLRSALSSSHCDRC